MKKAVMIGAGQMGRGLIAMLLSKSGYQVVFADVNMEVINALSTIGEYTVHLVDEELEDIEVRNISAINVKDENIPWVYADCSIICTAVGVSTMKELAPVLAESIKLRISNGKKEYVNIIACENVLGASSMLKKCVEENLDEEQKAYMEEYIGFPDCAVDRIIPPAINFGPVTAVVERFGEWVVLRSGFRGTVPNIEGMTIVDDLTPYIERKLFTLAGPNAVTGAYGYFKGYKTVIQSLADKEINGLVCSMMETASKILEKRHGFTADEMLEYRNIVMTRFLNPYIIDINLRVAREPVRKLDANDRLVMPMRIAESYGMDASSFYKGIALMMLYNNPEEKQCIEIQQKISENGFLKALEELTGITSDSESAAKIEEQYKAYKEEFGL